MMTHRVMAESADEVVSGCPMAPRRREQPGRFVDHDEVIVLMNDHFSVESCAKGDRTVPGVLQTAQQCIEATLFAELFVERFLGGPLCTRACNGQESIAEDRGMLTQRLKRSELFGWTCVRVMEPL